MWLSCSWSHAAQRGARSVRCQRGLVGYAALPRVHLIAYTQPIWPAPERGANTAYVLANRFLLDLKRRGRSPRVVGSLTKLLTSSTETNVRPSQTSCCK
ncbi:hypothetical protein VZT92_010231 [Zoarces viviparus]|uniref:Uncharacterized protein n=1 Tax=Zoarces viviparus TaxID=48416 RepID=A0AAW1FDD3_ZOAVI